MKRYIRSASNDSNVDWAEVIGSKRDELINTITELVHDAFGRPQTDVYIYPDGEIELFDNVGGNSWIDTPHFTVWTTRGFETASPLDSIYNDDLVDIIRSYDKNFDSYLEEYRRRNDYDSVEEVIREADVAYIFAEKNPKAYDEMIYDIISEDYDANWADSIVDQAIEEANFE